MAKWSRDWLPFYLPCIEGGKTKSEAFRSGGKVTSFSVDLDEISGICHRFPFPHSRLRSQLRRLPEHPDTEQLPCAVPVRRARASCPGGSPY